MKRSLNAALLLMGLLLADLIVPETTAAQIRNELIYTTVDQQPAFPGGNAALNQYLADNIRFPSSLMRRNYSTGPVAARFIIDKLGAVRDVRVITKPLGKDRQKGMQAFMATIIAAVEKMPRWRPAQVNGQSVSALYTLPIEVDMQ